MTDMCEISLIMTYDELYSCQLCACGSSLYDEYDLCKSCTCVFSLYDL